MQIGMHELYWSLRPFADEWNRREKLKRPFAGLSFFTKTNVKRCWCLASRHYPHSIVWSWALYFEPAGKWRVWVSDFKQAQFGPFRLHWQDDLCPKGRFKEQALAYVRDRVKG